MEHPINKLIREESAKVRKAYMEKYFPYIYLVYDECHGIINYCGTPEAATKIVLDNIGGYDIDPNLIRPDVSEDYYGWDVLHWRREEVTY
jgi:hypothetical protein